MPSPNDVIQLRSREYGSSALLVDTVRQGDRFATELILVTGEEKTLLLRSVEGDADQVWPPSPPLQEVIPQVCETGPYLAGIGGAGASHWSVSMTRGLDHKGIDFDFACRIRSAPIWLGSTYQILQPVSCVGAFSALIETESGSVLCEISESSGELELIDQNLKFRPCHSLATAGPTTVRWKYRFQIR